MAKRSASEAAETRQSIVKSARALFSEHGYANTTSRQISAAAGVTVGAMFHHFESKLALYRSVFEELELEMDAAARAAFAASSNHDPLEALLLGVRVSLDFSRRDDFRRIVLIDGPIVLGQEDWRMLDSSLGLRTVAGAVKAMKVAGYIPEQPTRPLAVLLMGAMNNAGFAIARGEPGVDEEQLIAAMRTMLIGMKPKG